MALVCRSKPMYHSRLLFASMLFSGLFLGNIFIVAHLASRDLSHRVIDQALRRSLSMLEAVSLPPGEPGAEEAAALPPMPVEACPPGDPVTTEQGYSCAPKRLQGPFEPRVFRSLMVTWHRIVTDTKGRVLWRGFGKESRLEASNTPRAPVLPGHQEVREEWQVGNRTEQVIALRQTGGPGSAEVREIGIPQELIAQEVSLLEKDLQRKLWIGAGAAALILLVGFLYVLRLLRRTRLLEAQAQMDDRLAFVGALAAGLAHEIRNPLNVLSMNLQMLEEDIGTRLSGEGGEARVYLSALQGEIRRLSTLVNNFLSYARPTQPSFESKDLNRVLLETCQFLSPEFESRGLHLRQALAPYLPPVELDESLIRQAVMNILMNAAQILKPGGNVEVQTSIGPDGEAIASIRDDGPGIKTEDRQRIFEVFFSTRGGGTGLGLPIAARILEAHGGSITVESEPGRGACFILKLPRRHVQEPAAAAGAVAARGRP